MFPYPGIPYAVAPAWVFPTFELSTFVLLLLCFAHAIRHGRAGAVPYLFGGLAFGLVLEYLEVLSHAYTYGNFHVQLGHAPFNVPVCIGCGWAIILYSSRLFSDSLRLSWRTAAALDTLLALSIDLSLDVVAYRLHMWHWYWEGTHYNPLTANWFGIPYGNFVGWITVVFCYSIFSRWFERLLAKPPKPAPAWRFVLIAVLALIASQGVLLFTEGWLFHFIAVHFGLTSGRRLLLFIALLFAASVYGFIQRHKPARQVSLLATLIPAYFHAFFLGLFYGFGFYRENPWMTFAATLNGVVGLGLHLLPLRRRTSRATEPESLPLADTSPAL